MYFNSTTKTKMSADNDLAGSADLPEKSAGSKPAAALNFCFPLQRCDDRFLQQLLPNVRPWLSAGRHSGGVAGEQQAAVCPEAPQSKHRGETQKGRDQCRQPGL